MTHARAVSRFINECRARDIFIEPGNRYELVASRLFEVMDTFNPAVVVKAGIGTGRLLREMALHSNAAIVVIEPSMDLIREFLADGLNSGVVDRIRMINGSLASLPVDYYACDLLVCVDILDLTDSSRVIDEFRRILQFQKHLFIATTVLAEDDLDGIYDELVHEIFPLHNDYYLAGDLVTILELNEFRLLREKTEFFREDIGRLLSFFGDLYPDRSGGREYLESRSGDFSRLYDMREGCISLPYYMAVFTRRKPSSERPSASPYEDKYL